MAKDPKGKRDRVKKQLNELELELTRISDDSILSRKFRVNSAVSAPQACSTELSLHFMYSLKAL
jgi:hypothetical protein